MYDQLKSLAKKWLPPGLLRRFEPQLRALVTLKYLGKNHRCNCCGTRLSTFIVLERGDDLCPRCGSLPRSRRLWRLLSKFDLHGQRVLHFSPPRALADRLRGASLGQYVTTDFENEFLADERYDITKIDLPDDSFDLIICYHVLEHIPDDRAAMAELYRVLAPGGLGLIQTPFREGETYEDPTITDAAGRLAAFGQEDHVRVYSVAGLSERLRAAGLTVEPRRYPGDEFYGWRDGETVIWARKRGLDV